MLWPLCGGTPRSPWSMFLANGSVCHRSPTDPQCTMSPLALPQLQVDVSFLIGMSNQHERRLTSGTTGARLATRWCACWPRNDTISSAVRPLRRAVHTLSRVSVPTKNVGSSVSHLHSVMRGCYLLLQLQEAIKKNFQNDICDSCQHQLGMHTQFKQHGLKCAASACIRVPLERLPHQQYHLRSANTTHAPDEQAQDGNVKRTAGKSVHLHDVNAALGQSQTS